MDKLAEMLPLPEPLPHRKAIQILQEVLDSFPAPELIDALEADAGPGYRKYQSGHLTDLKVRQARLALASLEERHRRIDLLLEDIS